MTTTISPEELCASCGVPAGEEAVEIFGGDARYVFCEACWIRFEGHSKQRREQDVELLAEFTQPRRCSMPDCTRDRYGLSDLCEQCRQESAHKRLRTMSAMAAICVVLGLIAIAVVLVAR